jgi:hypothetical protein
LTNLGIAISNFADYLGNLQLHCVPFLTHQVLALLIPGMRNLTVLGIYKCQLIHLGHTLKLLDIIKLDKLLDYENQISLDFYPNFHTGPIDGIHATGAYAVSWDTWDASSNLGIWQLVSRIIPRARAQGIDFVSSHTMFRKWLDKSPCWRVDDCLKALTSPKCDPVVLCAFLDFKNYKGSVERFTRYYNNRPEGWEWQVLSSAFISHHFFVFQYLLEEILFGKNQWGRLNDSCG